MNATAFRAALLDPDLPVPAGLTDPAGRPAGHRFAVYRNNVAASLRAALAKAFPLLRRLLGEAFFDAVAGVFLRQYPPESPVLWQYGAAMPLFLQEFTPVAHLPYLPCVARLELALRHSYHAADAAPLDPGVLAALPPDRLVKARLRLAPALRLLQSPWPVHGIWQAHQATGGPPPAMVAEDVAVLRPDFDPAPHLLPPGGAAFVAALLSGQTIGAAIEAAGPDQPQATTLILLLSGGAITGIEETPA